MFVRARFQPGRKGFLKGFLTVHMSTLPFLFLFFLYFFLGGANRLYVRLLLLYHEFEQFGSLHMYTPRKDFGRSGTLTRYPQTLESTTRPMSYPAVTNMNKIISNSIYNKNIIDIIL